MQKKRSAKPGLQMLCEGALLAALAQVLGMIKLWELPQGGSVTLSMLPIFLFCVRWGFGPAVPMCFAFSVLQLLLDGAFAFSWQSIVGDYLAAFTVLSVAGLFYRLPCGFYWGAAAGSAARFLVHWFVGATVWAAYMPERFFGMTMTSPWFYSALYNGSFMLLDLILILAVGALLQKPMGQYLRPQLPPRTSS